MSLIVLSTLLLACGDAPPEPTKPEPVVEAPAPPPPAPKARVFFSEPADGAHVKSPVTLKFGVEGMEVRQAGELVENTGHHHVIIGPAGVPAGEIVPKDETHIHFGGGQTEASIELPPGEHKLTMQFADGNHSSYGEVMAATITITVDP